MIKRIFSLILTAALVASLTIVLAPPQAQAAPNNLPSYEFREFGQNMQWRISTDGVLDIVRVDENVSRYETNWDIWSSANLSTRPWHRFIDAIKQVRIGVGIDSIAAYAFTGATSLTAVNAHKASIDDVSIERIERNAFDGAYNLTTVTLTAVGGLNDLEYIGDYAFRGCVNLTTINTVNVTEIGGYAFDGNVSLGTLNLPSVEVIENYAFRGCTNLTSIYLPGTMTRIEEGVFVGTRSLANITVGPSAAGTSLFLGVSNGILFAVHPTILEPNIFTGEFETRLIKAVANLPEGHDISVPLEISINNADARAFPVTSIDIEAFAYQSNLRKVNIPGTVTKIGLNAFSWSNNLVAAYFRGPAPAVPQVPNISQNARIFQEVANGFVIYFDYYPEVSGSGWPVPPATTWRGYTAIANSSYVLIEPSTPSNPYTPIVNTIQVGSTLQLRANVYPLNSSQEVSWSVIGNQNPAVITVSSLGLVHALSPGEVIVRATAVKENGDLIYAERRIHVVDRIIRMDSVTVDKTHISMTLPPFVGGPVQAATPSTLLTAIVHPSNTAPRPTLTWSISNTRVAYINIPNPVGAPHIAEIVAAGAGTATVTITARTAEGITMTATTSVTILTHPNDPSMFVPVRNITLTPSVPSVPMGGSINLDEISTVQPSNATKDSIDVWRVVPELSTVDGASISSLSNGDAQLIVPWGQVGTVVVEAEIFNGLGEPGWYYAGRYNYTQRFTINVVPFEPIVGITGVPSIAHVSVPLRLRGTVIPQDRPISWEITEAGDTGAYFDPLSGMLVAQLPGVVKVMATVENAKLDSAGVLTPFSAEFLITVIPYSPNALTVRADPGGRVSIDGSAPTADPISRDKADRQIADLVAHPNAGYIFAGWHTSTRGTFSDQNSAVTEFTMPDNATTVTAYFTYVGSSSGEAGGTVILPTPTHSFVNGNRYVEGSGVDFAHITRRDFQLFRSVTLGRSTLTRNSHYTAERTSEGHTRITLSNGYLDTLSQGSHTLEIIFSDRVSVTAVFTVVRAAVTTEPARPPEGAQLFDDVRSSDWFFGHIVFVNERGWMTASSSNPRQFRPNASVTQGDVVDALYRMSGRPSMISPQGGILSGRQAAIEWALQNGLTPSGGQISADSSITRQDIVRIISRLVSLNSITLRVIRSAPNFSDEWAISSSLRSNVTALYRAGIIEGRAGNTFVPQGSMTRGEFAAVLFGFTNAVN